MAANSKPENKTKKKPHKLTSGADAHVFTKEERDRGRAKSHETRRRNKQLRELAQELLNTEAQYKIRKMLKDAGVEDTTNASAMMYSQIMSAIDGNTKAAEFIRDTSGQKPKDEIELTEPIQINIIDDLGKE